MGVRPDRDDEQGGRAQRGGAPEGGWPRVYARRLDVHSIAYPSPEADVVTRMAGGAPASRD